MIRDSQNINSDERTCAIDMLVIHYTGRPSLRDSLKWLLNPQKKVSAHYLIGEEGEVFQLVPEAERAWHAGEAHWDGEADINSCSIGIELQNPGHEFGYEGFSDRQIDTLIRLAQHIMTSHDIPANRVLGHSDVAPSRKQDPGEKFPWKKLAQAGIGIWPEKAKKISNYDNKTIRQLLVKFGYNPRESYTDMVTAFQRHWQPDKVDGVADAVTVGRLKALTNG